LIICWKGLGLIWYIVCLSFHPILPTFAKFLAFLVFSLGLPIKKQTSWKLDVYYLINIHCTPWQNVPINGTMCSCFSIQWQDLNIFFKNKCWNQPISLFNNIILLALKIGYLLIIYIKHEIGLIKFQVKHGFYNAQFTFVNLFRNFYMFIE
jgi:hypothetical protein